ncbi:hypothetical protein BRADI_4g36965v3 [Brachypodium distachyon]|uniref:Transposase Tnp1/En/Spm-like domain-containing protein n=1 Tax=Brachypodium distachyon TaxID=15368 RepID=A0A2K2CSR7_BRADI|nr:hypothetical protein BRADI_4g36965v3 [Brachypodium distachyon]
MVNTRRLNITRSCTRNGRRDNREESFPQVDSSQEFDDNLDHVVHHDDDPQNMLGNIEKVNKRGRTALPDVYNLPDGARIVVSCNPHGQPIGEEGGVLGKFLGVIAKNGAYCPLNEHDWRKVKKDGGDETILQCVQTQFLCPPSCKKWILKTVGRDWRRYKATLKKGIFKPNANKKRKALYKLCPEDVEEDQWKELVKFWKSKEGRDLSEKNKRSRSLVKTNHTAGTKSFARWAEDIRQKDPEKRQPHRAIVYLATHRKRPKDNQPEPVQNEHVIQLEDLIDNQPELAQNDRGRIAWEGDALHQVLGEEKAGQVHGMGLLPVPKQVYGRLPRRFKNMNISTQDTSYEGGADEREEIARLWEHIQKQDLVIEQLRNQQGSHENNETARDGTKIILKTHVYPNRRRVAYATFITNSPTHDVAGVQLGSEFMHVSLDEVIDAKEKLVRERFNCKTIGDAYAAGLTIAWPSAFVSLIAILFIGLSG